MQDLARVLCATIVIAGVGCTDVRDFEGTWTGNRVGEAPELRVGFSDTTSATLRIERADLSSLKAHLTMGDDVFQDALIQPIPGSEADVLGTMTFDGSPARVYTAFAPTADGGGDALVMVSLHQGKRVEVRVLRGGSKPLYGIFALERSD
jgi:hypothetical protein